jgi:8-oxo-dGTP pyrophosphatase MutT (NUDIX family)
VRREPLLEELSRYAAGSATEAESLSRMLRFLEAPGDPFARENPEGHFTGSAVVARPDGSAFLLVHHRKLGRWLQPGGHAEADDASVFATALREAREETGIARFEEPLGRRILDVDVHAIPAHASAPAHFHFDVRYLLASDARGHADGAEDPARPMMWLALAEALAVGVDASLARALRKASLQLAPPSPPTGERG